MLPCSGDLGSSSCVLTDIGAGGAIVRLGSSGVTREPGGEEGREGAISRGLVWDPHPPWQDEQVFFFFFY